MKKVPEEIENLDAVLEYLYKSKTANAIHLIRSSLVKDIDADVARGNWLIVVLDKLERDKHIIVKPDIDNPTTYNISHEGILFYKKGGYRKQFKKEKTEAFWKKVEDLPKRYWFVGLFLASLGLNVKDALQHLLKTETEKPKTRSLPQSQPKDTSKSHIVHSL